MGKVRGNIREHVEGVGIQRACKWLILPLDQVVKGTWHKRVFFFWFRKGGRNLSNHIFAFLVGRLADIGIHLGIVVYIIGKGLPLRIFWRVESLLSLKKIC